MPPSATKATVPPAASAPASEWSAIAAASSATLAPASTLVITAAIARDGEEMLPPSSATTARALDRQSSLRRNAEQIRVKLGRVFEVEASKARDPVDVDEVLQSVLKHAIEGHESDEGQRRQEGQGQRIERRADLDGIRHQSQGDQPTGHSSQEYAHPPVRFGDRLRPRALEREVLGGDEGDRRGGRLVRGYRSLAHRST